MDCRLCGSKSDLVFKASVLRKYEIGYYYCQECGFLQTETPFWLQEAYKDPINIYDTGCIARNISISKKLTVVLCSFFNRHGKFVDFAGGHGVLVRLMRDIGFDFYWYDKYASNLFARGFEWKFSDKAEAVTCFEGLEHFVEPLKEIEDMLTISRNLIFTTELLPDPLPKPHEWWYYGCDHGQHISFYSVKTLRYIATKYGLRFVSDGGLHIFSERKVNEKTLKLAGLLASGLYRFYRVRLESKTWSDHILQMRWKLRNESSL